MRNFVLMPTADVVFEMFAFRNKIFFSQVRVVRIAQRCVDAEKKLYSLRTNSKNDTTWTQHSAAFTPTKFRECRNRALSVVLKMVVDTETNLFG